jgi:mono/diheme cytochrome c family protein
MHRLVTGALAVSAFTLVASASTSTSTRREPTHTVWDSVYTDAQTVRGDSLYRQTCVKCHGPELAGGDDGSPLVGDPFLGNWDGQSLDQLYDRIRNSMPPDNPKSIPRDQVADVLAFVLAKNHFPAGATPLTDDPARLKDIKVLKRKE